MGIKDLIAALGHHDELKDGELEEIEKRLDLVDEDSDKIFFDAALNHEAPEVFRLIETLAQAYSSSKYYPKLEKLFAWLMTTKNSPVFTWEKLTENKELFTQFKESKLIPEVTTLKKLPLHMAIQAGRLDLIKAVIKAAGGLQKAGDINHMSVLNPAIEAMLQTKPGSQDILKYLLKQGANPQSPGSYNLPAIMQTIAAQSLYKINAKEKHILKVVQLLHKHGASLEVINPNYGTTPLMAAMEEGFKDLFYFLLDKASAASLNHKTKLIPHFLIFKLFDSDDNRLVSIDMLELLFKLKEKGLEFNKTIAAPFYDKPYEFFSYDSPFAKGEKASVTGLSILHFYIDKLKSKPSESLEAFDKHVKIIQALITHGADPQAKARFTLKNNEGPTIELTATEYLRKLTDKILSSYSLRACHVLLIKENKKEAEFLEKIRSSPKKEQRKLHRIFHQFRNLERVLSEQKPLPYLGLPHQKKIAKLATKKPHQAENLSQFNLEQIEQALIDAREKKDRKSWTVHKKAIETYIKNTNSLEDFLERTEQCKKTLQLHFQVSTNSKGETIRGSMLHRFFHHFDSLKFSSTWEKLRKFGQNCYGIDINNQYNIQHTNNFKDVY